MGDLKVPPELCCFCEDGCVHCPQIANSCSVWRFALRDKRQTSQWRCLNVPRLPAASSSTQLVPLSSSCWDALCHTWSQCPSLQHGPSSFTLCSAHHQTQTVFCPPSFPFLSHFCPPWIFFFPFFTQTNSPYRNLSDYSCLGKRLGHSKGLQQNVKYANNNNNYCW